ncbi:MAG: hypothetical protein A2049_01645 [Elusimicrobia bacterium GWA2_62_23]|nr:MAG: hypothetical protein A2049_01645 [Elusimicrobia bacterium GWA2_62_23]
MGTVFSETLSRLRTEGGFSTAYRFYHDNGGAPVLKVSYRKYLLMEQGKNLPGVERLPKLLVALRLPQNTPAARELVAAWLKTLAGEEIYADLFAPLLAKAAATAFTPVEQALRRSIADKKCYMTEAQALATLSSFEAYKCAFALEYDCGAWTPEELAKTLRIKKAETQKALKDFAAAGLAKEVKKGVYKSRLSGQMVVYPSLLAMRQEVREKVRGYIKRLEQESHAQYSSIGLFRADSDALKGYYPLLKSTVEASHSYSTVKKTGNSAAFFVIGRVLKMWDF